MSKSVWTIIGMLCWILGLSLPAFVHVTLFPWGLLIALLLGLGMIVSMGKWLDC